MVKSPLANAGDVFDPWVGKIPWRRKWQPAPIFVPEKFHGQRSLADYSPWGRKESDTTETTSHARTQGCGGHREPWPWVRSWREGKFCSS